MESCLQKSTNLKDECIEQIKVERMEIHMGT